MNLNRAIVCNKKALKNHVNKLFLYLIPLFRLPVRYMLGECVKPAIDIHLVVPLGSDGAGA